MNRSAIRCDSYPPFYCDQMIEHLGNLVSRAVCEKHKKPSAFDLYPSELDFDSKESQGEACREHESQLLSIPLSFGEDRILVDRFWFVEYLGISPEDLEDWKNEGILFEKIDQQFRQILARSLPGEFARTRVVSVLSGDTLPPYFEVDGISVCREKNGRIVLLNQKTAKCWDLFGQRPLACWRGKMGWQTVQVLPGYAFCHLKAGPMNYGKGTWKVCKLAKNLLKPDQVVVRLTAKYNRFSEGETKFQNTISSEILKSLKGVPGIVEQYASVEAENKKHEQAIVVYQRCYRLGNLRKAVGKINLSHAERDKIAHTLLCALSKMHENHIYHRDLKVENVLLDGKEEDPKQIEPAICDFDLGWMEGEPLVYMGGTPEVFSPERACEWLKRTDVPPVEKDFEMDDVWAMGFILYFLYSGKDPGKIQGKSRSEILDARAALVGKEGGMFAKPDGTDVRKMIIWRMLQIDPKQRMSAREAFEEFDRFIHAHPLLDVGGDKVDCKRIDGIAKV